MDDGKLVSNESGAAEQGKLEFEDVHQLDSGLRYAGGEWVRRPFQMVKEIPLTIYVNRHELVTLLCTPNKLTQLVIGFLYLEGLVNGPDDVTYLRVCADEGIAEVRLADESVQLPSRRVLTSGCSGGVQLSTGTEGLGRLNDGHRITASQIWLSTRLMREQARLYPICGGVHVSVLTDGERALAVAEDVGRHNTLDKIAGECLLTSVPTRDRMIATSGRISSEMLAKVAKMGVPVVVSLTSPTHRAVALAQELGITVVGYVRGSSFSVYAHGYRIDGCPHG